MNNNSQNYYYDYIGATGEHSIIDYIDTTSNILDNKINITSNTLNNNINITSNFILNRYDKLIKEQTENNLINTYINNSNVGGEIRFYVKNSGIFDINNASGQPYRVKIGTEGKLYLYYNYNAAIGLLETERWVEPINMLISHNVAIGNINAITGATDIALSALIIKVKNIEAIVYEANIIRNDATFYNPNSTYDQLLVAYNKIKASFTYANSIYAGIVGSLGFGAIFMIYGFIQSKINSDFIENNLQYQLNYNSNLTSSQRNSLISETFNIYSSNLNDMNNNLSNLNNLNGFINTSNQSIQFIPKLKANEITLNNKVITKFSLESLDNWVKTTNGWYWDATNGNLGINGTPNIQDFLIVGGQTTIQGDLIIETKFRNNNTNLALPATGVSGGNGDKLILKSGVLGIYPYSLGVNTNSLWYSVPPNANHTFYIGGISITSITSSGLSVTGIINASTNLQENGTNLTAKYLQLSGGTLSGTLNGTTINASSSLQENSVNLSAKYLQLSGGTMTGTLNGTIINASSNLQENSVNLSAKYLKLDGTNNMTARIAINNTGLAVPSTGIYGSAVGERIIFELGGILDHPYAIGRFTNQLWYSIPSTASHNFYCGGINRFIINSNGNVGIRTNPSIYNLDIFSGGASAEGIKIHNGTSQGFLALSAGVAGNPGFINFHRAGDGFRVGYIGYTNLSGYLDMTNENGYSGYRITGNLLVNERTCLGTSTPLSANTKLTISGTSTGFSQPLVDIKQLGAWDGNYALQVSGYTNLNGMRINGNDTWNTIYQTTANSDIGITQNGGNTSGGNINLSVYGAGGNIKFFTNSTNERMRINSSGNVGINSTDPRCKLDVNGIINFHNGSPFASTKMSAGSLTIGGQDFNYGGQFYPSGNWTGTNTAGLLMECADDTEIVIHDAGGRLASFMYYQGGSYNRFTMGRNMGWTGGASIFHFAGSVGINNPTPISSGILTFLSVGNAGATNSDGTICIGRNTGGGATRQFRIGYTNDYSWSIGDYGGNNIAGTWINQVYCAYPAPNASLFITAAGYVNMQYGYGNGSDIKIKTDIRTIDDALWKVQQLRGVYYTHITEGTKNIGLIAQEVEGIIPEVVSYDETNDIKCISYQNLVGLLINAIKEQQEIIENQANQIKNIMDILNRNNIK